MFLYCHYWYSLSFIYLFILSFGCFIILVLVAFLCYHLASSLMLCHFAAYFGQVLSIFNWFFISHFYIMLTYSKQFMRMFYLTFYAVLMCSYWLWMIQCHFIVLDFILMSYPWQPFINSNFIVFLAVLFWSFY